MGNAAFIRIDLLLRPSFVAACSSVVRDLCDGCAGAQFGEHCSARDVRVEHIIKKRRKALSARFLFGKQCTYRATSGRNHRNCASQPEERRALAFNVLIAKLKIALATRRTVSLPCPFYAGGYFLAAAFAAFHSKYEFACVRVFRLGEYALCMLHVVAASVWRDAGRRRPSPHFTEPKRS